MRHSLGSNTAASRRPTRKAGSSSAICRLAGSPSRPDKAGYVALQYGQRRPYEAGTPVTLSDGETLDRVDFMLPRGSVISVRVTDEFGEPVAGVAVDLRLTTGF